MSDIEDLLRQDGHPDDEPLTIERGHLEHLLEMAKRGDVASSGRRLRHGFRRVPCCSEPEGREELCYGCQAYSAAEEALAIP